MKSFLYFLVLINVVAFSADNIEDDLLQKNDKIILFKHIIPETILDSIMSNKHTHHDLTKKDHFVLNMREVSQVCNLIIEKSENFQKIIQKEKMLNLLKYFFLGIREYRARVTQIQKLAVCQSLGCILGLSFKFIYRKFSLNNPLLKHYDHSVFFSVLIAYLVQNQLIISALGPKITRIILTPYFYKQSKKKQKGKKVIKDDLAIVMNRDNTFLSTCFESLILKHCFDPCAPYYEFNFNRDMCSTLYGCINTHVKYSEPIICQESPAIIHISLKDVIYNFDTNILYKLIDFSDEFLPKKSIDFKEKLSFSTLIDIKIVPKFNDNHTWNHELNKIDILNWFEKFKDEYQIVEKKDTRFNIRRFEYNNPDQEEEELKNIQFLIGLLTPLFCKKVQVLYGNLREVI